MMVNFLRLFRPVFANRCKLRHVVDNVHNFINDQIREQDGNSIELKVRHSLVACELRGKLNQLNIFLLSSKNLFSLQQ